MTSESGQDSGTGAASPTSDKEVLPPNAFSLRRLKRMAKSKRQGALGKLPVAPIFFAFAIGAPIMLVGLPLGALWIVQQSGCCPNQSIEHLISFWGSVLGGMLALFGTLIAAVFVITAFRIDKSARAEAAAEAADSLGKFVVEYKRELLVLIEKWLRKVKSKKAKAKARMEAASTAVESAKAAAISRIDSARNAAEAAKDTAIERIDSARAAAESASEDAVAEIGEVRDNVARSGEQATTAMDQATVDVDRRRGAAIERIEAEVAEVVRAVAEARARIQAQPDDSPPSDTRD